jgi:cytoskeleton protein RodZ
VSFGISLKRERELRGVSLAEISRATKISVRLLEAIEKDRFDILPEGVFRKSFIKSYAKYLGMNEEQILHEYDLQVQPSTALQADPEKPSVSFRDSAGSKRPLLFTLAVFLVLLAVGCGVWYFTRDSGTEDTAPPAPESTVGGQGRAAQPDSEAALPAESTATPVPAQATSGQSASLSTDPSALKVLGELAKKPESVPAAGPEGAAPLELTVEANSLSWVSVSAGESSLFAGLMNASDSKKFSLEAPLKVTLGNAGGVRLQVNGQVFSSVGKVGERRILEISAANYQQYLPAAATP